LCTYIFEIGAQRDDELTHRTFGSLLALASGTAPTAWLHLGEQSRPSLRYKTGGQSRPPLRRKSMVIYCRGEHRSPACRNGTPCLTKRANQERRWADRVVRPYGMITFGRTYPYGAQGVVSPYGGKAWSYIVGANIVRQRAGMGRRALRNGQIRSANGRTPPFSPAEPASSSVHNGRMPALPLGILPCLQSLQLALSATGGARLRLLCS
jgi:hypothetical protein